MENKNQNKDDEGGSSASGLNMDERISFVDPKKIIKMAGIKCGDRVADFGCGAGYFSIPAATIVGEGGEIYSFDVLPSAIEAVESHAKVQGVDNIIVKRVNLEKENSTKLANESVDWVIIKDVLFQNGKGRQGILKEAKRILKSGGSILVMEWNNNLAIGPDSKSRITTKDMIDMIFAEDFVFKNQTDAGDYHYVVTATKM